MDRIAGVGVVCALYNSSFFLLCICIRVAVTMASHAHNKNNDGEPQTVAVGHLKNIPGPCFMSDRRRIGNMPRI